MEVRTDVMDLEIASLEVKKCTGDQQQPLCSSPKGIEVGALARGVTPTFKDILNGTSLARDLSRPGTSKVAQTIAPSELEARLPKFPEFNGGGKLLIPSVLENYGATKWCHTLVGYFLGKPAPYPILKKICMQLWQKKGLVEVGAIRKNALILRFDNEQHLDGIIGKADWHIAGCPLLVRKWQPGTVINEEPTALPCWLRLYGIPLELWHTRGVQYLASSVGQLLKTDARSFSPANMGTARVQIECVARNGLSKTIEAIDSRGNPFTISIVYETKALCCRTCGVFGHDEERCSKKLATAKKAVEIPVGIQEDNRGGKHRQFRPRWRRTMAVMSRVKTQLGKGMRKINAEKALAPPVAAEENKEEDQPSDESVAGENKDVLDDGEFVPESVMHNAEQVDDEVEWDLPGGQHELARMDKLIERLRSNGNKFVEDERSMPPDMAACTDQWKHMTESDSSGLYETKLRKSMEAANHALFRQQWKYVTVPGNNGVGRMKICWDDKRCRVIIITQGSQWVHTRVEIFGTPRPFFATFIYGSTDHKERVDLWNFLLSIGTPSEPWCIMGDFNAIRCPDERLGGRERWREADNVLNRIMYTLGLDDLRGTGCHFTWSNRRSPPIIAKLDRVIVNKEWIESYRLSEAHYLPPATSDHSPCVLRMGTMRKKAGAFKYFDFWRNHDGYAEALRRGWSGEYVGLHMFRLCCKLKDLKRELKALNREHLSAISSLVDKARLKLQTLQSESLNGQPKTEEEKLALEQFTKLARMEESFFRQKARATWLKLGDRNTSYFHGEFNRRANRNAITSLQLSDGSVITEPERLHEEIVKYFEGVLSKPDLGCHDEQRLAGFIEKVIKPESASTLVQQVTNREIKETMFSMPCGKAPGPDGFTVEFYKSAWMERLRTAEFWYRKGIWSSDECVFCHSAAESRDHLFYQCCFVKKIWDHLGEIMHYSFISATWEDMERLFSSTAGMKSAIRPSNAAVILLYHIWAERCRRRAGGAKSSAGSIAVRTYCMLGRLKEGKELRRPPYSGPRLPIGGQNAGLGATIRAPVGRLGYFGLAHPRMGQLSLTTPPPF
ncbi:hypothetical protein MLD38_027856 [Melastoma candidum]|uniref:Uncharacterized protein n=1 Tax=Melastoma candidum TaxID=119954 RepID=A0ACB9MZ77_9MYRT|nr:hypothetical protein MLD38_027856 [Melastoma candidum]